MKDISAILHSFGFLESEVRTYLASLTNGPATVLELVKLTHLSRQATYVVIESLTRRGLMSSVIRGKKKYYVAEDPDKLLSYAQRKEQDMKDQMSDLHALVPELKLKMGGERPVVKLFEGKEGLRAMITDIHESRCMEVQEIIDLEAKRLFIPPKTLHPVSVGLKKIGAKIRGIYSVEPVTVTETEWGVLPKEMGGFKSGVTIYGDKIAFFSFEGKLYSVILEHKGIAQALRILFELASRSLPSSSNKKKNEPQAADA